MIDRSPDAERTALEDFVRSEGYAIQMEHLASAWGAEACERALRDERAAVAPEEWPFASQRILDTFAGMRASLRWAEERLRTLKGAPKVSADPIAAAFNRFRRGPRN